MIKLRPLFLCIIACITLKAADDKKAGLSGTKASAEQQAQAVLQTLDEQQALLQSQKFMIREAAPWLFRGWPEFVPSDYTVKNRPSDYSPHAATSAESLAAHKKIMDYINTLFGEKGLGCGSKNSACDFDLFKYVKQFYFYFEYVARLEKASKMASKTQDWETIVQTKGWQELVKNFKNFDFTTIEPDVTILNALFTNKQELLIPKKLTDDFWTDIQTSSFWTIPVSYDDMRSTRFWQDYIKCLISNSIYCNIDYCRSKEGAAYNLMPQVINIESTYYIPDFTYERHQYETAHVSILLNDMLRNRLLKQCPSWQKIPLTSTTGDNLITIAQDLRQTPLIKSFIEINDQNFLKKVTPSHEIFQAETMFEQQEKRLMGMAMALGLLIQDLFDDYKTAQTMVTKLAKIPANNFIENFPSLLMYTQEDAPYILELAYLHKNLNNNAQQNAAAATPEAQLTAADQNQATSATTQPQENKTATNPSPEATSVSSANIFDDIADWGKDVITTVGKWGKNMYGDLFTANGIFASVGKVIYYGTGAAMAIQGASWGDCKDKLESVKDDLKSSLHDLSSTCGSIIAKAATYYAAAITFPYAISGEIVGIFDKDFGQDMRGMYVSIGDAVGSYFGHLTELAGTGIVVLSSEGLAFFSGFFYQAYKGNLGDTFAIFGQDLVNGILQGVVIAVDLLKSEWDIIGKAIGYLVKTITDLVIDVVAGVWAIGTGNFTEAKAEVAKHKRLIAQGVGCGLFIGAAIATGGIGGIVGGAFFAATFAIPSLVSGVQQDDAAEEARLELNNYFYHFAIWIQNQKKIARAFNTEYEREFKTQLNVALINQKLANGFTENEQFDALESFECSEAYLLGSYQMRHLLTDPSTGIYKADPGNTFLYNTGWYNLNPSQGLVLYEPGRLYEVTTPNKTKEQASVFAQEVAVTPPFIQQRESQEKQARETLYWFLQSISKNASRSTQNFEIRFRPLYLLDHFYIGIGMGGIPIDVERIKNTGLADLDQYYHAKMVVLHQDNVTGLSTQVGVYEHESPLSDGWLKRIPWNENHLQPGTWYRMKMSLPANSNTLALTVWKESDPQKTISAQVPVTKLEDNSFVSNQSQCSTKKITTSRPNLLQLMIIFSGASIEWMVIDPVDDKNSYKNALKAPAGSDSEADRKLFTQTTSTAQINKNEYRTYAKIYEPFANRQGLDLTLASAYDAIKGYYMYHTNKTIGAFDDFLILGTFDSRGGLKTIGKSPTKITDQPSQEALISLVTGKVYRAQSNGLNTSVGFYNAWPAYKQDSALSQDIINSIENAQKRYFKKPNKTMFGLFNLSSEGNAQQGEFIYATQLKLNPNPQDQKLQDDYVVLVTLDSSGGIKNWKTDTKTFGLSTDNVNATGLVSLTTSLIYTKDTNPMIPPAANQKRDTAFTASYLNKMTNKALKEKIAATQNTFEPMPSQSPSVEAEATKPSGKKTPNIQPGSAGKGTIILQQSGSEDIDLGIL